MGQYFAGDYTGPEFILFGPTHLAALGLIVLLNLYLAGFKHAGENTKRAIRYTMAGILWTNEIAWHAWNYAVGRWTVQTMLPLQLCSLLVWTGALMLVTRSYAIYEFSYFLGIGGALQAVLTPDLGIYGFPHFRFFQTFISHGLIITSAIYMTSVEGFRPTWKSMARVFLWTNLYMGLIFIVNNAIDSNYLMVNGKPSTPSVLDLLPAWPTYILFMELLAIVTFLLLYLPFMIQDWRRARPRKSGAA